MTKLELVEKHESCFGEELMGQEYFKEIPKIYSNNSKYYLRKALLA